MKNNWEKKFAEKFSEISIEVDSVILDPFEVKNPRLEGHLLESELKAFIASSRQEVIEEVKKMVVAIDYVSVEDGLGGNDEYVSRDDILSQLAKMKGGK